SPYDAIDEILRKMEIGRLSEPKCSLYLVFWEWGKVSPAAAAAGTWGKWGKADAGTWITSEAGHAWKYRHAGNNLPPGLWPGMGQLNRCVPPRSTAIEQALLQGMLLFPGVHGAVSGLVSAADYWRSSHRVLHQAIAGLAARSVQVDPVTVGDDLNRRGELSRIGGAKYLQELISLELPEFLQHDQGEYEIYARCIRKLAEDRLVAVAERAELERGAEL
ncbi:MAG TPA: DnaB-like helicase N-terminal domain-containing protein, partial [Streptosporangiaceae bacterium]|nr:DnaB-like helicase N-terminal domain-containing protein [Streptosporangiaceae bacterium]